MERALCTKEPYLNTGDPRLARAARPGREGIAGSETCCEGRRPGGRALRRGHETRAQRATRAQAARGLPVAKPVAKDGDLAVGHSGGVMRPAPSASTPVLDCDRLLIQASVHSCSAWIVTLKPNLLISLRLNFRGSKRIVTRKPKAHKAVTTVTMLWPTSSSRARVSRICPNPAPHRRRLAGRKKVATRRGGVYVWQLSNFLRQRLVSPARATRLDQTAPKEKPRAHPDRSGFLPDATPVKGTDISWGASSDDIREPRPH
jgi:hypothetical protein